MASRGNSSEKRKKILEELQQKACELSTILGSEVTTKTSSNPLNQAGSSGSSSSSSRSYMLSFQRQFTTSGHNPFRGKGKGLFMRDVILLTGPDINSVPRQGKRVWQAEFCLLKYHMQTFISNAKNASSTEIVYQLSLVTQLTKNSGQPLYRLQR